MAHGSEVNPRAMAATPRGMAASTSASGWMGIEISIHFANLIAPRFGSIRLFLSVHHELSASYNRNLQ